MPNLRGARTVRAVHVYNEPTTYENAAYGLDFQREAGKFVTVPGKKRVIYRPGVIFTDADDKMLLIIEVHVTHKADYKNS